MFDVAGNGENDLLRKAPFVSGSAAGGLGPLAIRKLSLQQLLRRRCYNLTAGDLGFCNVSRSNMEPTSHGAVSLKLSDHIEIQSYYVSICNIQMDIAVFL